MNHPDRVIVNAKECYGFRGPPFPQKLFTAMDSPNALINWTNNGRAICVDAEEYERSVMSVHPGLVEIPEFPNFRRQMREYGFDWLYHVETREFEFSHPSFLRGRPDLLLHLVTRRKRRGRCRNVSLVEAAEQTPQSAPAPRRRSVIAYAGSSKKSSDSGQRAVTRSSDVNTAKSLSEMTDEEWWKCCAPAIVEGINGVEEDGACRSSSTVCKFNSPLYFWSDDASQQNSDEAMSAVSDGSETRRILNFDEL